MTTTPVSVTSVPLVAKKHKGLKVSQDASLEHLKNNHAARIFMYEFVKAANDYAIVFAKSPDTGNFMSVVMWGVETGENLYVDGSDWVGGYVPESVRCYPFTMQAHPDDSEKLYIGLFETVDLVNKDHGELMFNEDGSETEWMSLTKKFLGHVYTHEFLTSEFVAELDSLGLLIAQSLSMNIKGKEEPSQMSGFYIVDKAKLDALSDEDYLKLRKNNAWTAIYAHLSSLANIKKLIAMKNLNNKSEEE